METRFTDKEINILHASEILFAEKGFDATSTREISAAAGVNISMISYYFGSKERLFETLFEYRMNESTDYAKEILQRSDINAWDKLMQIIERYMMRVEKLQGFYRILQVEQIKNQNTNIQQLLKKSKLNFLKIYSAILAEGHREGLFANHPMVELLHATVIGTIFFAYNGVGLYALYSTGDDEALEAFRSRFFNDLRIHIKNILKNLLGYEEQ